MMVFERVRIIVGYDGSLQSRKALEEAATIAKCFSGFIRIVSVYEKGKLKEAETKVAEAEQSLRKKDVVHESLSVLGSNPGKILVSIAKKDNFDLIVIGSRGLGGSASMLLGSVSKQVVSNAYGNVLVVKK